MGMQWCKIILFLPIANFFNSNLIFIFNTVNKHMKTITPFQQEICWRRLCQSVSQAESVGQYNWKRESLKHWTTVSFSLLTPLPTTAHTPPLLPPSSTSFEVHAQHDTLRMRGRELELNFASYRRSSHRQEAISVFPSRVGRSCYCPSYTPCNPQQSRSQWQLQRKTSNNETYSTVQ